jgi:hypothetical protein
MQIVGFVVFVLAWKEIIFPAAVCKFQIIHSGGGGGSSTCVIQRGETLRRLQVARLRAVIIADHL